ncbi:hypothetical protein QN277_020932 [Acacia crassicarpa]|uniref:Uncharacterized protein n=1 Tax=Acacia crassicarpa TaxID=499986 RepID=A0AAE1MNV6_9FABA|nr:hypothetical protein QN277_020932 [Acacia crassicarpa]
MTLSLGLRFKGIFFTVKVHDGGSASTTWPSLRHSDTKSESPGVIVEVDFIGSRYHATQYFLFKPPYLGNVQR